MNMLCFGTAWCFRGFGISIIVGGVLNLIAAVFGMSRPIVTLPVAVSLAFGFVITGVITSFVYFRATEQK